MAGSEKDNRMTTQWGKWAILLLVAAALVVALILGIRACGGNKAGEQSATQTAASAAAPIAAEANQGEYQAEQTETMKNITMPGWTTLTIAADTTEITKGVDFFNPEDNEGYYDMTFELFVDVEQNGTYESVYQSGLVYPGNHVQKITLNRSLPAGTYDAYVHIQPYLKDDQSVPLNSGNVQLVLHVQ